MDDNSKTKLEELQNITSYNDINTRGGFSGKLIRRAKQLILRTVGWYVEPVCIQQSEFNRSVVETLKIDSETYKKSIDKLQDEVEELKELKKEILGEEDVMNLMQNYYDNRVIGTDGFYSYAQSGEDGILQYVLIQALHYKPEEITYVDLGANHAKFLSNTYALYRMGARGILVEANPHLIPELQQYRRRDTILNRCVNLNGDEKVTFYIMNGDGLSTPSYEAAQSFMKENDVLQIVDTVEVETISVNHIFTSYLHDAPTVLNIDIEGNELEILKSIDLDHYRPLLVICEMIEYKNGLTVGAKNQEVLEFMESSGYTEYASTGINSIFIDTRQA